MEIVSPYLPGILLSYGAFLIASASPGPNVLAVIGTSMAVNRPSGMALAMGVATGTLTWGGAHSRWSVSPAGDLCFGPSHH